jgi:hypothetical protein
MILGAVYGYSMAHPTDYMTLKSNILVGNK